MLELRTHLGTCRCRTGERPRMLPAHHRYTHGESAMVVGVDELVRQSVFNLLLAHSLLRTESDAPLLRVVVSLDVLPQSLLGTQPTARALGWIGLASLERDAARVINGAWGPSKPAGHGWSGMERMRRKGA
eukprot:scaffold215002_cov37-Tisochrysis_lutea.AAC.1